MTDTARDVIATIYIEGRNQPIGFLHASAILAGLQEAGFRILGPGELDNESLEAAAKVADTYPDRDPAEDGNGYWAAEEIAAAIREMKEAGK